MRLFKYVQSQRVDILKNERIAFTPPHRFSDLFEMRLGLSPETIREQKKEIFKQIEKQAERESPEYRRLSSRQRKKGRKEMTRGAIIEAHFKEGFRDAIQKGSHQIGVLCLSISQSNNLMWDRYAEGHKGFVIEFDTAHEAFRNLGASWKVEYVDEPPIYDLSKPPPLFFRFKSKSYEHESEYRIVRPLHECILGKGEKDVDLHFRSLPRTCINAVYLGHLIEKNVREEIFQFLKGTDVKKFKAIPSRKDYSLSFQEIK